MTLNYVFLVWSPKCRWEILWFLEMGSKIQNKNNGRWQTIPPSLPFSPHTREAGFACARFPTSVVMNPFRWYFFRVFENLVLLESGIVFTEEVIHHICDSVCPVLSNGIHFVSVRPVWRNPPWRITYCVKTILLFNSTTCDLWGNVYVRIVKCIIGEKILHVPP